MGKGLSQKEGGQDYIGYPPFGDGPSRWRAYVRASRKEECTNSVKP